MTNQQTSPQPSYKRLSSQLHADPFRLNGVLQSLIWLVVMSYSVYLTVTYYTEARKGDRIPKHLLLGPWTAIKITAWHTIASELDDHD